MSLPYRGKRVLVTGGTGFIGSLLVERLLGEGAELRLPLRAQNYRALSSKRAEIEWLEGDLRDPEYCKRLVDGVDRVFHLAACRRNLQFHHERSGDVVRENVRMSLALLEGLRDLPPIPVTVFSTANVPPSFDAIALAQQEQVDGYVLGKALSEILWFTAARQRHFPLLVVRPVGVYGPRDTFREDGNIIPSLMVQARDSEKELVVWGDGTQERAFLYVEDLISSLFRFIEENVEGVQYVSSETVISLGDLARQIVDLVRPDLPIRFDASKPVGERAVPLLPLHDCLKDFHWTPFHEGLRKTYESWK